MRLGVVFGGQKAVRDLKAHWTKLGGSSAGLDARLKSFVGGPHPPGAFGWWELYRDWLIRRAIFHAQQDLEARYREDLQGPEKTEALWESDRAETKGAGDSAFSDVEAAYDAELVERDVGDLTAEERPAVHALPPRLRRVAIRSLPLLLRKQRKIFLAFLATGGEHGDRNRTAARLKMSATAFNKVLNRAFERLRRAGLAA